MERYLNVQRLALGLLIYKWFKDDTSKEIHWMVTDIDID